MAIMPVSAVLLEIMIVSSCFGMESWSAEGALKRQRAPNPFERSSNSMSASGIRVPVWVIKQSESAGIVVASHGLHAVRSNISEAAIASVFEP